MTPGSAEQKPDPLDRIEAKATGYQKSKGKNGLYRNADVLTLVEVARAARELVGPFRDEEREHGFPFNFALRDAYRQLLTALARLDKEPAA